MPTNANAYNSRLTDETLEKRFRDTFRSQGGAELVDDLYASGVIVPVVDFTAAAEGSALRADLQQAWDFSTGYTQIGSGASSNLITTPGFWRISLTGAAWFAQSVPAGANITISDGFTAKVVWEINENIQLSDDIDFFSHEMTVFVRTGDTVACTTVSNFNVDVWYRQIADVSGNLVNPTGFTFS